jgi:hypothetical protein
MCGRVIQSSGPLRYDIVAGMNVRDSRVDRTDFGNERETRRADLPF